MPSPSMSTLGGKKDNERQTERKNPLDLSRVRMKDLLQELQPKGKELSLVLAAAAASPGAVG